MQPSLVIVYFGGNDSIDAHCSGLGPHVPLDEYIGNMRKIAEHLKVERRLPRCYWHGAGAAAASCLTVCFAFVVRASPRRHGSFS